MITIALDAMSGDNGLNVTVGATLKALKLHPDIKIIMVGIEDKIKEAVGEIPDRLQIHHASQIVEMNESPTSAMRNKKDSSMRVSLNLVKEGKADAVVSAGNTGALMATSRYVLKMLSNIDRPVLCTALPGEKGPVWMLDLGANIDADAEQLLQFGLMGAALVKVLLQRQPRVGLLNVGSEEIKGNDKVKKASELLKVSKLNYLGYIEGDEIFKSKVDLVVCDGFVGNVALKSIEGLAKQVSRYIKIEISKNWLRKMMAILVMPILKSLKTRLDTRTYNGASLLGLGGVVIKSHGGTDETGMLAALTVAYEEVKNDLLEQIELDRKSVV